MFIYNGQHLKKGGEGCSIFINSLRSSLSWIIIIIIIIQILKYHWLVVYLSQLKNNHLNKNKKRLGKIRKTTRTDKVLTQI